jgi:hypothetical protein
MKLRVDLFTWITLGVSAAGLWFASAASAQDVARCREALDTCVIAAQTPADIEVCSAQEARCIAGEMQVPVPDDVPVEGLISCTATATECVLTAPNIDSITSCSWALTECIDLAIRAQLSCVGRFTQCVLDNPLLAPICSFELLGCTD